MDLSCLVRVRAESYFQIGLKKYVYKQRHLAFSEAVLHDCAWVYDLELLHKSFVKAEPNWAM
jgi:hypothetical protein